ncbi:hypothetical protein AA958_32865 [Streptomyces sp. CNQ-509]|nr:hypothetical protein AA958_32865 [Streptomyces sp. CNQ-509]
MLGGLTEHLPGVVGIAIEDGHQNPAGLIDHRPGPDGLFELGVLLAQLGQPVADPRRQLAEGRAGLSRRLR